MTARPGIETVRHADNFIHVLVEGPSAAVVDPGVAGPVESCLRAEGLTLDLILVTHHHGDHTGGCRRLQQVSGCRIAAPAGGAIGADTVVADGDEIDFAGNRIEVLGVPGHTGHDVAFYLPSAGAVFTGDTLFACGCGRVFGGNATQMWTSLCRLRALPDDTRVFGGHDYTLENLEFATHLEPGNSAVRERLERFNQDQASVCSMAEEKLTNPFLRCDEEAFADALGMRGQNPADVFAFVRGQKDRW